MWTIKMKIVNAFFIFMALLVAFVPSFVYLMQVCITDPLVLASFYRSAREHGVIEIWCCCLVNMCGFALVLLICDMIKSAKNVRTPGPCNK